MPTLPALIIGLSACLAQAEALTVVLPPAASASGAFTTLGDLSADCGLPDRARDIMLGRAPREGETVAISRDFVAARLSQEGFPGSLVLGSERVLVVAAPAFAAEFERAIVLSLARELRHDARDIRVTALSVERIDGAPGPFDGAFRVSRLLGGEYGRALYRIGTGAGAFAVLAEAGPAASPSPPSIGRAAAVRDGETVRVEIRTGALRITTDAVALESAAVGGLVRLKNARSGRIFSARVTGPGTATPE